MEERSRWRWTRARRIAAIIAVCAIVVYGAVVALYALSDRSRDIGCQGDPPADSLLLELRPEAVDAAGDRIAVNLAVRSFGPLQDPVTGLSTDAVTLYVTDTDGSPTHTFEAGQVPSPIAMRFITDGYIERWPFDAHVARFAVVALRGTAPDGTVVPVTICGTPNVPGWMFASEPVPGTEALIVDGAPVDQVQLSAHRAGATTAFGLVILALMVVMPALTLTVAVVAYRGRRKVEATLMSWMAAMVFATIPLRGFLPGSPPIGSWVDYLVVLWVLVGLVIGLIVYVLAWLRWSPVAGAPREQATDAALPVVLAASASAAPPVTPSAEDGGDTGDGGGGGAH
ncbi:DUF4436 family protein [Microbacterium sp. CJ88]|uniref:DUF4436 family protein n=1 Tax=Microbacterium sp. CJ88 TaxID=3445672 RepID=UPI003F65986A